MRITGGLLRGRKVELPEGIIRPSMDRMRESIFAILGDLSGKSFLDIFSGSGIIALEAASRGAAPIEAVEQDTKKCPVLLKNVSISPVRINCRFMAAELYIKRARKHFNLIFCDPPFNYGFKNELLEMIAKSPLMEKGSLLLLHRPKEEEIKTVIDLEPIDKREYGRSIVNFFIKI